MNTVGEILARATQLANELRQSVGMGDVVHAVAQASGIAAVVHKAVGHDCGCNRRREWLNAAVPFRKEQTPEGDNRKQV